MGAYPIYEAATPFNASELGDMDFEQSFDTIYLTHHNHPFSKFVRADHDDWIYSEIAIGPTIDAPGGVGAVATNPNTDAANSGDSYFPQLFGFVVSAVNGDGQESRASAVASASNDTELPRNYTTITWSAVTGAEFYRIYKQHEGGSFGFIGETEALTFRDDGFAPDYSDAPIEGFNPIGSPGNYPSRIGFWEQRLWLGNTINFPNAAFASRSSDFENFDVARPLRENDSISLAISTGQVNAIEAFVPMERLLVGTSDNIMVLRGANDDILAPNPPPAVEREVGRGISKPKPIVIGEAVFYQPHTENGARSLGYTFEVDGYRSSDITIFCPHLFKNKRIVRWAYAAEPMSAIYAAMDDGQLYAFTWESEQQVWGWSQLDIGGFVEDVAVVPEGNESRIYVIVRRTIDGTERRYIERFGSAKWEDYKLAYHLDCARGLTFETPQSILTGFGYLEGETVSILADGQHVTKTVVNGQIDLGETAASTVIVGLPYEVLIETLPLPRDARKKITGRVFTDVVDSFDWEVGREIGRLEQAMTREFNSLGAPQMFTGKVENNLDQRVDRDGTMLLRQSNPYPFLLTGIYFDGEPK